jgi:hypothetical protein
MRGVILVLVFASCLPSYQRGEAGSGGGSGGTGGTGGAGGTGPGTSCNPVDLAGTSTTCGAGKKCGVVSGPSGCPGGATDCDFVVGCVPAGLGQVDDACTWTEDATVPYDVDSCAGGTQCVGDLAVASCRRFCAADADCTGLVAGSQCVDVEPKVAGARTCSAPCTLADTSCPTGFGCTPQVRTDGANYSWDCRPVGAIAIGGSCNEDDCVAGADCFSGDGTTYTCLQLCDADHACPDGKTCLRLAGLARNGGYCE